MQGNPVCPRCGKTLRSSRFDGLCPACMLGGPEDAPGHGQDGITPESLNRSLPEFEVLEVIGEGGMGSVFRARQFSLNREVALKMLRAGSPLESGRFAERFVREAQVTAQLDHPSIVPVYDTGYDREGRCFYTMPLVKGRDLGSVFRLAAEGRDGWNLNRALGVLVKVCQALAFAHGKGVVHRDLKPSNIMVGDLGEVYVMDWGLARMSGCEDIRDLRLRLQEGGIGVGALDTITSDAPLCTLDGAVIGTPAYMSPEQARGDIPLVDHLSDLYSLGAILYELLTGHPPYMPRGSESTPARVLGQLLDHPVEFSAETRAQAAAELVSICRKAMARDRRDRYSSALGLAEDLQAYLDGRVVQAYESGPAAQARKWIKRNRALAVAAALAVSSIVVGLAATALIQTKAKREVQSAFDQERAAKDTAVAHLASAFRNSGLYEGDQGAFAHAALWFAHAASLNRPYPEIAELDHARSAEYGRSAVVPVRAFKGAESLTESLQFSDDGRFLLRTYPGGFELYDVPGERQLDLGGASSAVFLPGASAVAISREPDRVEILSLPTLALTSAHRIAGLGSPTALGISADARTLVAGGRALRVWDLATGELRDTLPDVGPCRSAIIASPHRIALYGAGKSAGTSATVVERPGPGAPWQIIPPDLQPPLVFNQPNLQRLPSPDGLQRIASSLTLAGLESLADLAGRNRIFSQWCVTLDGLHLASADQSGLLRVWNLARRPRYSLVRAGLHGYLRPVIGDTQRAVLPVGLRCSDAYSRSRSWSVPTTRVYDLTTGRPRGERLDIGAPILNADFPPSSGEPVVALACAAPDRSKQAMFRDDGSAGSIQIWNYGSGQPVLPSIPMPSEPRAVRYHPDGSWLAVLCAAGQVLRIDPTDGAVTPLFREGGVANDGANYYETLFGPGDLRFTEDGSVLLVWGLETRVFAWNTSDGRLQFPPLKVPRMANFAQLRGDTLYVSGVTDTHGAWDFRSGTVLPEFFPARDWKSLLGSRVDAAGERRVIFGLGPHVAVQHVRTGEVTEFALGDGAWSFAQFLGERPVVMAVVSGAPHPFARVWDYRTGRALTPEIRMPELSRPTLLEVSGSGAFAGAVWPPYGMIAWDLRRLGRIEGDEHLTDRARIQLAELNAYARLTGDKIVNLDDDEWIAAWRDFRARHPEVHRYEWSDDELARYHSNRAIELDVEGEADLAAWHRARIPEP